VDCGEFEIAVLIKWIGCKGKKGHSVIKCHFLCAVYLFGARSQNCERRLLASSRLSVCPSVRVEQLRSHWTDFHEILYLSIFRKSRRENSSLIKIGQEQLLLYTKTNITFSIISHSILIRMRNVSDESCRENQNTHFMFDAFFFSKIVPFMR